MQHLDRSKCLSMFMGAPHLGKSIKIVETKRKIRLTGGESSSLVTTSELDVEVGDQSMDVVIPLHLQAEW